MGEAIVKTTLNLENMFEKLHVALGERLGQLLRVLAVKATANGGGRYSALDSGTRRGAEDAGDYLEVHNGTLSR